MPGWGARWVSLALVPVMLGAFLVHWSNGGSFTSPNGGWEYPAFLIAALVAQVALGNGAVVRFPARQAAPSEPTHCAVK